MRSPSRMTRAASIPLEARSPPSLLRTRPARTPPFACHETRAPLLPAAQRTSPPRLPTPQPLPQYTFASRLSHRVLQPACCASLTLFADFFHCRRVVCAVLSRLFGTVGLCNKLQTQKKKTHTKGTKYPVKTHTSRERTKASAVHRKWFQAIMPTSSLKGQGNASACTRSKTCKCSST